MLTINLTTTCQRLSLCRIALVSLLLQSRLPDRINLWVSKDPYLRDSGVGDVSDMDKLIKSLPDSDKCLIHIRWVKNTGPYRKLIPMLREAKHDDLIVTADDDIFYGADWLSGLLDAYENSEGKVVAARVRMKKSNFLGKKTSYLYWNLLCRPSIVEENFVITFGGGVVLTRSMFSEKDIADDSFLDVAPTADDLWYSKLLIRNRIAVVVVPSLLAELNFIEHSDGLVNHNFSSGGWFLQRIRIRGWNRLMSFFGVPVCGNDLAHTQIDKYFD